jgi:hypothetical protein
VAKPRKIAIGMSAESVKPQLTEQKASAGIGRPPIGGRSRFSRADGGAGVWFRSFPDLWLSSAQRPC